MRVLRRRHRRAVGRQPEVHQRKAGTFAWSEAVAHTVQNVGQPEGRILRIELKY